MVNYEYLYVLELSWRQNSIKSSWADLHQDVKILQSLRDWLCPHLQGATDDLMPCCPVYIPVSGLRIGMECEPSEGSQKSDELGLGYLLTAVQIVLLY
jgi:hypothetical protein